MDREVLQPSAIHEAGHAVAFFLQFGLGELHRIGDLEIGIDESAFCVGDMVEPDLEQKEKTAIMLCAGYAALIVAGYQEEEALQGTVCDFEMARMQSKTSIDSLKGAAVELLSRKEAGPLIKALSQRLIGETTVPANELQDFFLINA